MMASRLFNEISNRQLSVGGSAIGLGCVTIHGFLQRAPRKLDSGSVSPADIEFRTSSKYSVPANYEGEISHVKNNYPHSRIDSEVGLYSESSVRWPALPALGEQDPLRDKTPWLEKDLTDPKRAYEDCSLVKPYCWEGNVNNGLCICQNQVLIPSRYTIVT